MAQKQYVTYKAPLESFAQDTIFLGVLNSGRFCGFDTLAATASLSFTIAHTLTGIRFRDFVDDMKGPVGKWLTKQGVIIAEDDTLGSYAIDSNAGNDYYRYDIFVGTHAYSGEDGEQLPAMYSVIKGALGVPSDSPVLPALIDQYRQTILGIIIMPPQAANLTGVKYIKMAYQDTGDELDAKLKLPNAMRGLQQWYEEPISINSAKTSLNNNIWELPNTGNTFKLNPPKFGGTDLAPIAWQLQAIKLDGAAVQNGTRITVVVNKFIQLISDGFYDPTTALYNLGYRKLMIPAQLITGNQSFSIIGAKDYFQFTEVAGTCILDLELVDDVWVIKNISQTNGNYLVRTNKFNGYTTPQVFGNITNMEMVVITDPNYYLHALGPASANNFNLDLGTAVATGKIITDIKQYDGSLFPNGAVITISVATAGTTTPAFVTPPKFSNTAFSTDYVGPYNYTSLNAWDMYLAPGDMYLLRKEASGWKFLAFPQRILRELWLIQANVATVLDAVGDWVDFGGVGGGTYDTGWGKGTGRQLQMRRDFWGRVELTGHVQVTTTYTTTNLGNLPALYRPASKPGTSYNDYIFTCGNSAGNTPLQIAIDPTTGAMTMFHAPPTTPSAGYTVFLDGIIFPGS